MKKQLFTPFILAFGLLAAAQPSLAMKRSRLGHPIDHFESAISAIVFAAKWFLATQPSELHYDDPHSFRPNHITFVSQSGTHFNVQVNDLEALLKLSRTIAALLSDLQGSDISTIPLQNVHNSALYLLTQMASGAEYEGLVDYVRALTPREVEELKREAELLDSQALLDLVSSATENHFTWLPSELLPLILEKIGPKGRSSCASVDRPFNEVVSTVRKPIAQGGCGWTDTLPVVATLKIGETFDYRSRDSLVFVNDRLYVMNDKDRTVSVFDTTMLQLVATLKPSDGWALPIVEDKMTYQQQNAHGQLDIIDTTTNQLIITFPLDRDSESFVVQGHFLYMSVFTLLFNYIVVIDLNTNQIISSIQVFPGRVVVRGQNLKDINLAGDTIEPPTAVVDKIIYELEDADDVILVIDTDSDETVATIQLDREPWTLLNHGQNLYVANLDGTLSVIDKNEYEVVAIIEVGRCENLFVHDQKLYVVSGDSCSITVIDIGGHLPGQI